MGPPRNKYKQAVLHVHNILEEKDKIYPCDAVIGDFPTLGRVHFEEIAAYSRENVPK